MEKDVTMRDIVRLMNDKITDLEEEKRVEKALEEDPQLQKWYQIFDLESRILKD